MTIETLLLMTLRSWRDETARRQGIESYRVFPNATLEAIAFAKPLSIEELLLIKGIKEVKSRLYGRAIIDLVRQAVEGEEAGGVGTASGEKIDPLPPGGNEPLSVSHFLDGLNLELSGMAARIRGEVTSADVRERVVYFTLKDKDDESVLNCLIFRYQYEVGGVKLSIGDEVIIEGAPDIYKPSGRLSLRAESIEYAGEGALKKAYDELYQKLEAAGMFAPERKRELPKFPERIALITSREGAALGDFTMNLARAGLRVDLYPTLVEGKRAVFEIIKAIEYFNAQPEAYDVLVIIRGGGSLESLQAFNTEALVQAVRASSLPVLAGIGHERDVSLAALAADAMVSTPTATAKRLSEGWDEARERVHRDTLFLSNVLEKTITGFRQRLEREGEGLREGLGGILERVSRVRHKFQEKAVLIPQYMQGVDSRLDRHGPYWKAALEGALGRFRDRFEGQRARIEQYDPVRALRLGYSLVRAHGKIVREAGGIRVGERLDIQLGAGRIESEVKRVVPE